MYQVFKFADKNEKRIGHFESSTYLKFHIETKRQNRMLRLIPNILRLERGNNAYLGESFLQYNYTAPNMVDSREVAFYSTMPYMRNLRDQIITNLNLSIYEPNLMQKKLLSPLNRRNRTYYIYHLDSIKTNENGTFQYIQITPRFYNTQLMEGQIKVNATTGSVIDFSFSIIYNFTRIKIKGEMGNGDLLSLLPKTLHLYFEFNLFGNKLRTTVFTRSDFSEIYSNGISVQSKAQNKYDLTYLNLQKTDTTQTIHNYSYFKEHRPIPLSSLEDSIYHKAVRNKKKIVPDSLKKKVFFSDGLEDILLDNHSIHVTPAGQLSLPPIITPSMLQWSKNRGVSIQTKIKYKYTSSHMREFNTAAHIGYNFKLNQLYWKLPIHYTFSPSNNGMFHLEVGNGNRIYSSKQADEIRKKIEGISDYDSLQKVFNAYDFNYFNDFYTKTSFSIEPFNGLQLNVGLIYHQRSMKNWNEVANKTGLKRRYESFAPNIRLVWTPQNYYYRNNVRKVALFSPLPTFTIDYERGVKIASYKNQYERWEFDASYKLPLYALRSLYFRAGTGFYTSQKQMYFVDYANFSYNSMPNGWEDELMGEFQLLERHWYNESNYYARLCTAYESPMLLLSRLKMFTRFITTERLYCNVLMVNALKPYLEIGYGASTHLGSYALFVGGANASGVSVGAKVAFHLFDD